LKEQSTLLSQVSQAINQVDRATQSTAVEAEHVATSTNELKATADSLAHLGLRLQTMAG
jgi:methyl-accepting chemotaxis protein